MTSSRTPSVLAPCRTGARATNPNAGKGRASSASRRQPRLHDGVRSPVTVSFVSPARARAAVAAGRPSIGRRRTASNTAGTLPRVRSKRADWTAERILVLAERAEARGWHRRAATLLALALERS